MEQKHLTRILKLMEKVESLIQCLDREQSFRIHQFIDQFYYMEKHAELKTLVEELTDSRDRTRHIMTQLDERYREVFCNWQKDSRWLVIHNRS